MGDWIAFVASLAFAVWMTATAGWVYGLPAWLLVILSVAVLRMRRSRRADSGGSVDESAPGTPPDVAARAESVPPVVAGTQSVLVRRESWPWRDRFRSYRVVLDGEVVGRVRSGAEAAFPVEPGPHSLDVRIDWTGSGIKFFNVLPGQNVAFTCCAMGSYSIRTAFETSGSISLVRDEP